MAAAKKPARARQNLSRENGNIGDPGPPNATAWPAWVGQAVPAVRSIEIVEEDRASRGFLTLFADSLRTAVRWWSTPSSSTLQANPFTVYSGNGYQLDYFPQFQYSPVAFAGGKKSSPVTDHVPSNHYKFEGWLNNTVTRDSGTYFAGPASHSAHLRSF